jgi:putative membrane protein
MNASMLMGAEEQFGHMNGWGGGWMWLWGTLMMVVTVLAIVWIVRAFSGRQEHAGPANATDTARAILAERYARGELTTEEYHERRDHLV